MLFRTPEYEDATALFFGDAMHAFARIHEPLLAEIREEQRSEGSLSSTITGQDGTPVRFESKPVGGTFVFDWADVLEFNLAALYTQIDRAGAELGSELMKGLIEFISRVTDATGNVVRSQGIKPEAFVEALEKMEIDFDDDGTPHMPTVILHPDTARKLEEQIRPEHSRAIEQVIARKRKEHLASRRSRRIP